MLEHRSPSVLAFILAASVTLTGCPGDDSGPPGGAGGAAVGQGGAGTPDAGSTGGGGPGGAGAGGAKGGTGGGSGGVAGGAGAGGAKGGAGGGVVDAGTGGAGTPDAAVDAGPVAVALEPVATYAFHDLTALKAQFHSWPVLSGDGRVVAFANGAENPTRIVVNVVNADGTGQQEIDSYTPLCYCGGVVDINVDGQAVATTDSVQIRHVKRGSAGVATLTLNSNEIWDIRLSGDGGRIFFLLRRDAALAAPPYTHLERGVWVVNADGSGLRQITGATLMAGPLGTTADKVFPFAGCGRSMEVSRDGTRVAFAAAVAGMEGVFAVNSDGSGLRKLLDASGGYKLVGKIGMAGNGQLVGYHLYVGDNLLELGVIGFDGSGRRKISNEPPVQLAGCQGNLELTDDGSKMYVSEAAYLYNTDGTGVLQLTTMAYRPPGGAALKDGTPGGTMSADGKRFVFRNADDANIGQIMLLELDPPSLGAAPALTGPTFSPGRVSIKGLDVGTATVRPAAGAIRIGVLFYSDGLQDIIDRGNGVYMRDDGMHGDATASDGTFTGRGFYGFNTPKPGPKNLRFTAETKVGALRHGTVLEARGVVVDP